ncbi:MAG TPA: hypothetical protein PKD31_23840, partial [Blastocatellia bacterium]|nr:hypothetical protein [Blastocatellia bacterium]
GRNWTHVKREQPVEPTTETKSKSEAKPTAAAPETPSTRPRVVTSPPATKQVKPVVQASAKKAPAKSPAQPASKKPAPIAANKSRGKAAPKSKKKPEPPKPPVSDRVDLQNQIYAIIPFKARLDKLPAQPSAGLEANGNAAPESLKPDWLIAKTWDGYFFTDDEKKGWKPFKLWLKDESAAQPTINTLLANPHAPGELYAGTNDGLFVSRDNGNSFQLIPMDEDARRVRSIVFDPRTAGTIYLGTSGGLFRSQNGGKTWDHLGSGMPQATNVGGLVISAANPDEIYLYDEIRVVVFHSKDRGQNWGRMDISQLPSLNMLAMIGDPFDADKIYAASYSGGVYVMSRK